MVELAKRDEFGMPLERSRYDKFVEDVVSEKVAKAEGLDPEASARVLVGYDADGDPEFHIFGRSRRAVDAVADAVNSPRMSVRRRYIGTNVSPDDEREMIGEALDELVRSAPDHMLEREAKWLRGLRDRLGLQRVGLKGATGQQAEVLLAELNEAIKEFEPGERSRGKGGDKGG